MAETRELLGSQEFSPDTADFEFGLYILDYESLVFLPGFLQELRAAPGLRLEIPPGVKDPLGLLREGRLDLIVGVLGELPSDFHRQHLFDERFACVTRKDHPLLRDGLTLDKYVEMAHMMITTTGTPGGPVDDLLAERGLERTVGLRLPHFLAAPLAVAESDMVLTLPERLARKAAEWAPLSVWEPPVPLPGFSFQMIWHERNQSDKAHRWVRERAASAARHLQD